MSTNNQNSTVKALTTGVAVVGEMITGGLFLENVKMEKQRTSMPYKTIMSNLLKQGISGFEAGLWPWGLALGITKGIVLGGSKTQFDKLFAKTNYTKKQRDLASGFAAGAVQGLFMAPILLARTHVNQHLAEHALKFPNTKLSPLAEMKTSMTILSSLVQSNGYSALTKGMGTCIIKRALDWGTRFYFIDMLRTNISQNRALNDYDKLSTAFIGGALSVLVTTPIDRLLPLLQSRQTGSQQSLLSTVASKIKQEGITTMFRGGIMRTIHTGYHTMFAIYIADKLYSALSKVA